MPRPRSLAIVAVVALLAPALAACGGSKPVAHKMAGIIVAPECAGGYEITNAQITLRDEAEKIIGTANTSDNLVEPVDEPCAVSFTVRDVPDAKFYSIKIGTHEGPVWSLKEMAAMKFRPELTLGNAVVPAADSDDFCAAAAGMDDLIQDTTAYNDDPYSWEIKMSAFGDKLSEFAAGLLIRQDGVSSEATEVLGVADAAAKFEAANSVKQLNDLLELINPPMSRLTNKYPGCPTWSSTTYTPHND